MTPIELLRHLESLGFALRVKEDGRLGVSPSEKLTPELRDAIQTNKEDLLSLLEIGGIYDPEKIWPGIRDPDWRGITSSTPLDECSDLPDLLRWWDEVRKTIKTPLVLAPGVVIDSLDVFEGWVNRLLTAGVRKPVAEQLRWVRKVVDPWPN